MTENKIQTLSPTHARFLANLDEYTRAPLSPKEVDDLERDDHL